VEGGELKTRASILGLILAALPWLAGYGCAGNHDTPAAKPQTKGQAVARVATGQPADATPKVTASQGKITISGSKSGSVKAPAQPGGYLIKYRYKGQGLKLEAESAFGMLSMIPGGQAAGSDGWTQFDDLTAFAAAGEQQYRITASEPFEIQFVKLPFSGTPDIPPKSYSGSGLMVVGPVLLKAGSASFKVTCPDLKQAGFIAELYDGTTAQNKGMIALGTGASVAETKKLQVASAGNYMVKINANGRSEWTLEVTQ